MNKKEQRSIIKNRLNNASQQDLKLFSEQICRKLYSYINDKNARYILSYKAMNREVDLSYLEKLLEGTDVRFAYPISGETEINFYFSKDFSNGKYGIQEPIDLSCPIDKSQVDLIIVPLVGFDKSCQRLGHGKGYYDRFLSHSNAISIGVGFELQKLDRIACDNYDQKLNYIFTEEEIYSSINDEFDMEK